MSGIVGVTWRCWVHFQETRSIQHVCGQPFFFLCIVWFLDCGWFCQISASKFQLIIILLQLDYTNLLMENNSALFYFEYLNKTRTKKSELHTSYIQNDIIYTFLYMIILNYTSWICCVHFFICVVSREYEQECVFSQSNCLHQQPILHYLFSFQQLS